MTGRVLLFVAGIVVVVPVGIGVALFVPARFPNGTATPVLVSVPVGASPDTIADQLADADVLGSKLLFRIAVRLRGGGDQLLAGDYAFPKALSPWSAVGALRGDKYRSSEVTLTFPEGFTTFQIEARLSAAGVFGDRRGPPGTKCAAGGGTQGNLTKCIGQPVLFSYTVYNPPTELRSLVEGLPTDASLEGYLFPDTYRFLRQSDASVVIGKFLDNFRAKRVLLPAPSGSAVGHTFHEAVILASIVEREVRSDADRGMAADIFWRRIALGMPLQSDATVNYATGKAMVQPTLEDTKVDSLYNTYLHPGLPPGPIGNPGLVSLTATLNPKLNDYLYFLTPPDGSTVFAKTYEEHLANKAEYLK